MREELYILIWAVRHSFDPVFMEAFPYYIEDLIQPELPVNCKLIGCEEVVNPQTNKVLDILDGLNTPSGEEETKVNYETERGLFRFIIESDEQLKYRKLPWLENILKNYVVEENIVGGAYFPYLIKEDGLLKFATPSRLKIEAQQLEDVSDDDWTFLNEHAELLDSIYYGKPTPEESIFKEAKLSLLMGR